MGGFFSAWFVSLIAALMALMVLSIPRRIVLLDDKLEIQCLLDITEFDIRIPEADESYPDDLTPQGIVEHISRAKAAAAAALCTEEEIVITADTMVFLDHERLGKPRDEADAFRILSLLSGRHHEVMTGMTVVRGDEVITHTEVTRIHFRQLHPEEIRAYIASGEPMDKAGAYGIQGGAALFADQMEGDYYNVMGLPVCRLAMILRQLKLPVWGVRV